jgi:hypothetical protein
MKIFFLLAVWSLITGISDCYTYFFTDVNPTGAEVAWGIVRIVPIAEILFAIGWFVGIASLFFRNR